MARSLKVFSDYEVAYTVGEMNKEVDLCWDYRLDRNLIDFFL